MVGDQGAAGRPAAGLTGGPPAAEVRAAYTAAADQWAAGPEQMYAALARALLAAAGVPLAGRRVLDIGAGTGVAARAALAAGAGQVVATDLTAGMLGRAGRQPGRAGTALGRAVADAAALPFLAGSFDLAVAAFCLGYLRSVSAGLAEAHRVAAALAASMFTPGWTHPAKPAVDAVLGRFGYRPPAWYAAFKQHTEPAAADPGRLAGCVAAAGFSAVRLRTTMVATGLSGPAQLAGWRLGMAHVAPFVATLDPPRRAALRRAAEDAVAGAPPLTVSMTVLTAS